MNKLSSILILLVLLHAPDGFSIVIVAYDVTNANAATSPTVNTSSVAPGVNASVITANNLDTPFDSDGTFAFNGFPAGVPNINTNLSFTVTPQSGTITYSILNYSIVADAILPGGPKDWEVRASTDGFVSSNILLDSFNIGGSGSLTRGPIDISILGVQAGSVEFRVIGGGNAGDSTGGLFSGPNLTITGTVVPEPSSYVILIFTLLLLFKNFRKKHGNMEKTQCSYFAALLK